MLQICIIQTFLGKRCIEWGKKKKRYKPNEAPDLKWKHSLLKWHKNILIFKKLLRFTTTSFNVSFQNMPNKVKEQKGIQMT